MTVLIPAMLAVLLAEFGRNSGYGAFRFQMTATTALGIAVGVSAAAGLAVAPMMTAHARALLLALALFLTGAGQFGRLTVTPSRVSRFDELRLVWRSGAPFLAFAFAAWKAAPVGAAAGALLGIAASVALGTRSSGRMLTAARRSAGTILIVIAVYAATWALRLI